jgi:hypothetical protein
VLLVVPVGSALGAFAPGLGAWVFRYRRRPHWQVRLNVAFSIAFLALGGLAIAVHAAGLGLCRRQRAHAARRAARLLSGLLNLGALAVGMLVLATLGHVGGTLVFGR